MALVWRIQDKVNNDHWICVVVVGADQDALFAMKTKHYQCNTYITVCIRIYFNQDSRY